MATPGASEPDVEAPGPTPGGRDRRSEVFRWIAGGCLAGALVIVALVVVRLVTHHDRSESSTSPATTLAPLGGLADPAPTGFSSVEVTIVDAAGRRASWCLLLAANEAQRRQGLMWVTDRSLGGYDGMLFRFSSDVTDRFWMRNTPQNLSIAYYAADGSLVSTARMYPCGDHTNCPTYPANGPYRYAVEVPAGNLGRLGIGVGSKLIVPAADAKACPAHRSS